MVAETKETEIGVTITSRITFVRLCSCRVQLVVRLVYGTALSCQGLGLDLGLR